MISAPAWSTLRPKRGTSSCTDMPAAAETAIENGTPVSPACSGVQPRPTCMYSVQTRKKIPRPTPKTVWTAMPAAKLFTLNRDSSTSGDPSRAALRFSYATSAAKTRRAPPIDTYPHSGQPSSRPRVSG
jgi:hypothetical protein